MLDTAPSPILHFTSSLFQWFRDVVRPILEEHAADRIEEFERQLREIEQLTRRQADPLSACFLGQSQIGKSTLINALVAQTKVLLPAGGVGPLTAQAIQVGYAAIPFLEVCYQPKKKVNQLIFALERQLDRTRTAEGKCSDGDLEDGYQIEEEDRSEIIALDAAEDGVGAIRDRIHQAKLLVTGGQNQQIDLDYLCDALRLACEWPNKWGTG